MPIGPNLQFTMAAVKKSATIFVNAVKKCAITVFKVTKYLPSVAGSYVLHD